MSRDILQQMPPRLDEDAISEGAAYMSDEDFPEAYGMIFYSMEDSGRKDAEGIEDEAMACITNKRLLGEDETDNKTHFNVGDTVWGYLYEAHGYSYLPEKYVISEVLNGDDELIYRVRGHGTLMVCEANLHLTYKDALMDSVHDIIRDTKGRLYAIGKTCERLNIEFNTPTLLPN